MNLQGTFDDRNDARLNVKAWMAANSPEIYTRENIQRVIAETVRADRDPVDGTEDSWREGTYGAWIGIIEFASEEIARIAERDREGPLRAAVDATRNAVPYLPHNPPATLGHIHIANVLLRDNARSQEAGRALGALGLAQQLLRR